MQAIISQQISKKLLTTFNSCVIENISFELVEQLITQFRILRLKYVGDSYYEISMGIWVCVNIVGGAPGFFRANFSSAKLISRPLCLFDRLKIAERSLLLVIEIQI